jgi:hypothetical protein
MAKATDDELELVPGEHYEIVIRDEDPKAPGKVYAGEFHHADQFAVVLIVDDKSARQSVVRANEDGTGTEENGKRFFGIPTDRIGTIRLPGTKGVQRNATPSTGE